MLTRNFNSTEFMGIVENEHKVPLLEELVDENKMKADFKFAEENKRADVNYTAYTREKQDVVDAKMLKNIVKECNKGKLKFAPAFADYNVQSFFNGYQNIVEIEQDQALIKAYLEHLIYMAKCRIDLEIDRIEIFKAKYKYFDLVIRNNQPNIVICEGVNHHKYEFTIDELKNFSYDAIIDEKARMDKEAEENRYRISVLKNDIENLEYELLSLGFWGRIFKTSAIKKQIENKKATISQLDGAIKELRHKNLKRLAKLKFIKLTFEQQEEVFAMLRDFQKLHYLIEYYLPDLNHSYLTRDTLYRLNYKEYVKSLGVTKQDIEEIVNVIDELIVKSGVYSKHLKNKVAFGKNAYLEIGSWGYGAYKYLCEMEDENFKNDLINSGRDGYNYKKKSKTKVDGTSL